MEKFGRESPSGLFLLCLIHALHLGVIDTFYKNKLATATSIASIFEDTDDSDDEIVDNKNAAHEKEDYNTTYETNCILQLIAEIKKCLMKLNS